MGVLMVFTPVKLMEVIKQGGDMTNEEHIALYQKVQCACDLHVNNIVLTGDDAVVLEGIVFNQQQKGNIND